MRMFKRLISVVCIAAFAVSLSTAAAFAESTSKFTGKDSTTAVSTKITSGNIVDALETKTKIQSKSNSTVGIAATESTNDPYEPNDDIASATTMPSDTIYATIGYDGDADFFKKNFSLNQNIAISLKSIPAGCDYDLYLCSMDGTILAASEATGTTDELIQGTINVAGDYLVVVLPYTGYNDSVQYKLYAGDSVKTTSGSYWSNTLPKLTLNYANTDSATDTLDLTYELSIPNGAVVTSMYLNGNYTGNFTGKELYTYISQVDTWHKANLSDICGQANGENAKQVWKFKWRVGQITQPIVSWTPQILINYQYTYIPY